MTRSVPLAGMLLLFATVVLGQPQRTFVSAATGSDLNVCSLASPCRNLNRGVDAVAPAGEVITLDSGGYGTLTISKSVTVAVPSGVYAGVTALTSGVPGIVIDTGGVGVKLRGLTINSLGGSSGVSVTVPTVTLGIERASISGFPGAGIDFQSNGGKMIVFDSIVRDSGVGIHIMSSDAANLVSAALDHVHLSGNGFATFDGAVVANSNSTMSVHESVASGNFRGFEVVATTPAFSSLVLDNSAATGNVVGLFGSVVGGGQLVLATMYVSNCVVTHNTLYAIEAQTGSSILTRGNNTVSDNAAAETFSGPYIAK